MMSENKNHEFTFSIEDNEYIIKKKEDLEKKPSKNFIHGPSIGIGASVTAICVLGIFFALNGLVTNDQELVEVQITETKTLSEPTQISNKVFFDNGSPMLGNSNAPITLIEFGDYQCHFCNVYFHNTEHKIIDNYVLTGKVNIIFKDFINTLGKFEIKKVECLGKQFDPNFHQAMSEELNNEKQPGEIIKVIQDGYFIKDRLLRPASVVVAKKDENKKK